MNGKEHKHTFCFHPIFRMVEARLLLSYKNHVSIAPIFLSACWFYWLNNIQSLPTICTTHGSYIGNTRISLNDRMHSISFMLNHWWIFNARIRWISLKKKTDVHRVCSMLQCNFQSKLIQFWLHLLYEWCEWFFSVHHFHIFHWQPILAALNLHWLKWLWRYIWPNFIHFDSNNLISNGWPSKCIVLMHLENH